MDHQIGTGSSGNSYPAGIWAVYTEEAEKFDRKLVEGWKDDMDATLVFAGLFSATVTAFIIESYKNLKPDSSALALEVLIHVSQQLATSEGERIPPYELSPFQPSSTDLRANVLFTLSLGFSLSCAFLAILVKQWSRNYLHTTQRRPSPSRRARIRAYLFAGMEDFQLPSLVDAIPTTLHISLFLFFGGLFKFFTPAPISSVIAFITLGTLATCTGFYGGVAIIAALCPSCPYQTPLSSICWHVRRLLRTLLPKPRGWDNDKMSAPSSLGQESEMLAMGHNRAKKELLQSDSEALRWTLELLTDNEEFEPFVAGIPSFLGASDITDSYEIMQSLLIDEKETSLGHRIITLFESCDYPGLVLPARERRAVACIYTLWSLASASLERQEENKDFWYFLYQKRKFEESVSTPFSLLRKFKEDKSVAIGGRARLALILSIAMVVRDYASIEAEQDHNSDINHLGGIARQKGEEIRDSKREAIDALEDLVADDVRGHPQYSDGWQFSLQESHYLALSLLLEGLPTSPFPHLVLPNSEGSIIGYLSRNDQFTNIRNVSPFIQRRLLRAIHFTASQIHLNNKLSWDVVTELFDLLASINDPVAAQQAIEVLDLFLSSVGEGDKRYFYAMYRAADTKGQLQKILSIEDQSAASVVRLEGHPLAESFQGNNRP